MICSQKSEVTVIGNNLAAFKSIKPLFKSRLLLARNRVMIFYDLALAILASTFAVGFGGRFRTSAFFLF